MTVDAPLRPLSLDAAPDTAPSHPRHAAQPPSAEAWWKTPRARQAAWAGLACLIAGVALWYFVFRPYVSTDDARGAATFIRLAPDGVGGRILTVNAEVGDEVHVGEVLVVLDSSMAEAQLARAQAQAVLNRANLRRTEQLASQKGVSQRELDMARAEAQSAEAELRSAGIALDRCTLRSPVDGVVVQKTAYVGNILEAGQSALGLVDEANAWVDCNVEETDVGLVKVGQKVDISVDEGGSLKGEVEAVASASASEFAMLPSDNPAGNYIKLVQRIPVRIRLLPHPGMILRAGESVVVHIRVR